MRSISGLWKYDIQPFFKYFFRRHHVIVIKTGLQRGAYYNADDILEAGIVSVLFDFVEIECAWMTSICDISKEERKLGLLQFVKHKLGFWRNPDWGVEWMQYQADNKEGAQKQKELDLLQAYIYFKQTRPKLDAEIEEAYTRVPDWKSLKDINNLEMHKEVDELEERLKDMDDLHFELIIRNRSLMWT